MITKKALNKRQIKTAIPITKCNSKICKPMSYHKIINDRIDGKKWRGAIEKELQNLKNHQIWKYDKLLLEQKMIGL